MECEQSNFARIIMAVDIVLKEVKKELDKMEINYEDVILEKINGEVYFYKCYCEDKDYIVKYYNCDNYNEILDRYKVVEKSGIVPICFVVGNRVVIYDGLCDSYNYRFMEEKDFECEEIVENIKAWNNKISSLFEVEEQELFSKNNLIKIMTKFNLFNNETFVYIYNNFDNIKLKVDRLVKTIFITNFSLDTLVICKNSKKVFGVSFDRFYVGNEISFLEELLDYFKGKEIGCLFKGYDAFSEEEKTASFIHQAFLDLYYCRNLKGSFGEIGFGPLLENCKRLVEWF